MLQEKKLQRRPPKTTKNNWGRVSKSLPTYNIKEDTAYFINEDYQYTSVF